MAKDPVEFFEDMSPDVVRAAAAEHSEEFARYRELVMKESAGTETDKEAMEATDLYGKLFGFFAG